MEKSSINNKNEMTNKLSLEILKLIQEQETKIKFLAKKLRDTDNRLLKIELETYILAACLNIVGDKYSLSRQERKKIIFQALEEIFPNIFS